MSQNCRKQRGKSGAKIVNATFTIASYLHPLSFGMQMWHLPSLPHNNLLFSFHIFTTYLQAANFYKSLFFRLVLIFQR